MGVCVYSFGYRRPKSAYEFLEYCHELGAGGVQIGLDSLEPDYTQKIRRRAEQLEMYLEVIADLPSEDPDGVVVGAVPERADPLDVVVSREEMLPDGAVVGSALVDEVHAGRDPSILARGLAEACR